MPEDRAQDLALWSATELVDAYRRKTVSPVEATEAALARIERLDGQLNAFCVVDRDGALAAARAAEARWQRGAPAGLVDGVPATVKDVLLTKDWPTLRGSRTVDPKQAWTEDSPAVARLREHGAVLLGKTTTPEFGWKAIGDSPLTGITRNPWSLEHTPGGSSAGAAAATAVGMGALAIGTDGAGSIRIPSSFTGLFGLKPTFGRVPAYPPSVFGTVSHVGPMTRTVSDGALMLTVLAGADWRDSWALPPDDRDYRAGLEDGVRGLKIGFSPDLGWIKVEPDVAAAVADAVRAFATLGATVDTVAPPFPSAHAAELVIWSAPAAKLVNDLDDAKRALLDPGLVRMAAYGRRYSALELAAADHARTMLGQSMAAFHQRYDLLVTPTLPVPALPVGRDTLDPDPDALWLDWAPFTYPFNLTRQPAATVPCGLTKNGLPIGLQIVGPLYAEPTVLRAARAFERARPFALCPMATA
ncbi:MAG TPA: amidase [Candidatus Sulfotelmatobacter sp.]|nr:amidase [Candidatus Sulfotelmatobacter sp.]